MKYFDTIKILKKLPNPVIYKPELFGLDNNLTGKNIGISIIGSGLPKSIHLKKIAEFDTFMDDVKNPDDDINLSTVVSSFINSKDKKGIIGISNNSILYFAKITNNEGNYDANSTTSSLLWSIIKNVDIISIAFDINFKTNQVYNAIQKANERNIIVLHKYNPEVGKIDQDGTFAVKYEPNIKEYKMSIKDNIINISFPEEIIYSNYSSKSFIESPYDLASLGIATGIVSLLFEKNKDYKKVIEDLNNNFKE